MKGYYRNYEKQVGQEAAYPIAYPVPISYNCYRHEKCYQDQVRMYETLVAY